VSTPETKFTQSGEVSIAYQVVGDGPLDLVVVPGFVSHVEQAWEDPSFSRFLTQLASFSRLILFDKRGTGLSDRITGIPTLEERMDDVRAVMDAAGSQQAALFGISEGGPMSVLFAATYSDRVSALVLYGSIARGAWAPDYPWGPVPDSERFSAWLEGWRKEWGGPYSLDVWAPSMADDETFRQEKSIDSEEGQSETREMVFWRYSTDQVVPFDADPRSAARYVIWGLRYGQDCTLARLTLWEKT